MPIRESERDRYPADWQSISKTIKSDRAGWRCECQGECGHVHDGRCTAQHLFAHPVTGSHVVLTVAHLDHTPENCDPDNLRAMCQRCHLAYDADHHAATRATTLRQAKEDAGQLVLPLADRCPDCGPGYRYGDDGCRHTPQAVTL